MTTIIPIYLASKRALRSLLACAAIITLLLCGCGRSATRRTLLHAESIMEDHPDSAYTILSALRMESTAPEEDRALHALLLTQAMHKTHRLKYGSPNDTIQIADSLMRISEEYYTRHADRKHLMISNHYKGVVESLDSVNFSSALIPLSRSIELSIADNYPLWTARSYEVMGDIFYSGGAYHDMTEVLKEALAYFIKAGDPELVKQAQLGVASGYINEGNYDNAYKLANEIEQKTNVKREPRLTAEAECIKAKSCYFKGEYGECREIIRRINRLGLHRSEMDVIEIMANLHLHDTNEVDRIMKDYGGDLSDEDKRFVENAYSSLSGDSGARLQSVTELYETLTEEYERNGRSDFNTIQNSIKLELNRQHAADRARNKMRSCLIIVSVIAISVIGLLLLYIGKLKMKKRYEDKALQLDRIKKELDLVLSDLDKEKKERCEADKHHESELEGVRKDADKKDASVIKLKQSALNQLIQFYYSHGEGNRKGEEEFLSRLRKEIKSYKLTPSNIVKLESLVNKNHSGIMTDIRKFFPKYKPAYIHVLIYSLLGFDLTAIAFFTEMENTKKVSNILYRIRQDLDAFDKQQEEKVRLSHKIRHFFAK